ncbi:MAG: hypothetical protein VKK80_12105 [Prochlorothrix sp.]|nr:hypothetical protein [Prochlorothrix sp.]
MPTAQPDLGLEPQTDRAIAVWVGLPLLARSRRCSVPGQGLGPPISADLLTDCQCHT